MFEEYIIRKCWRFLPQKIGARFVVKNLEKTINSCQGFVDAYLGRISVPCADILASNYYVRVPYSNTFSYIEDIEKIIDHGVLLRDYVISYLQPKDMNYELFTFYGVSRNKLKRLKFFRKFLENSTLHNFLECYITIKATSKEKEERKLGRMMTVDIHKSFEDYMLLDYIPKINNLIKTAGDLIKKIKQEY